MSISSVLLIRNCRGITDVTGAETYLMTLIEALEAHGCRAELLCAIDKTKGDTPWLQTLRARDIPHHLVDVPSKFSRADYRALTALIGQLQPQVLHAMDHRSDTLAVLASRKTGVPAVASFFGWTNWSDRSLRGRLYPLFDRLIMRRLGRIIVDSEQIGMQVRTRDASQIAVIPNGVNLARFDAKAVVPRFKQEWFGRTDITLIGMIGRIHPNKGQVDFAKAAAAILKTRPDTRFVVLGEPPPGFEDYSAELAGLVADLGISNAFRVTNVASADIPAAIASFDITALPSYMESLAYVMLESMAMKKPVVSANVGGHGALIDDGRNGFLFESGDLATFQSRLLALIDDVALRNDIGLAGYESVKKSYSTDVMVKKTLQVYGEVTTK